jgi:hypothetical protein
MMKRVFKTKILIYIMLSCNLSCSSGKKVIKINDMNGAYGKAKSSVSIGLILNKDRLTAAREGRLGISDLTPAGGKGSLLPAQVESPGEEAKSKIVMIMPNGEPGTFISLN